MNKLTIPYRIEGYKYLTFKYTEKDFNNLKDWMKINEIKFLTPYNLAQYMEENCDFIEDYDIADEEFTNTDEIENLLVKLKTNDFKRSKTEIS